MNITRNSGVLVALIFVIAGLALMVGCMRLVVHTP
jgi:hypothetical protein